MESYGLNSGNIMDKGIGGMEIYPYPRESTPQLNIIDRMVVTNSSMSLVVKDVRTVLKEIKDYVKGIGGYMVNSSQSAPDGPVSGYITVRVPVDKLDSTLEYLREKAMKVVSEDTSGSDITDQYVDIETRLKTLEGTKLRYESILDKATDVDEILIITNQILGIQSQIDNLKGSMKYMEGSSSSTLITIYLSTDEFELPYSPEQSWRPGVVFKYAVRSLVTNLRSVGSFLVWFGVYSIIWIPAVIVILVVRKKLKSKPENKPITTV